MREQDADRETEREDFRGMGKTRDGRGISKNNEMRRWRGGRSWDEASAD